MSLRFRLALLNTFFVLMALGLAMSVVVVQTRQVFLGSIDRELMNRAERMMGNPNLRQRDEPLRTIDNIPDRQDDNPNGPPEANPGQGEGGPPGQNGQLGQARSGQPLMNRVIGQMIGPEFAGPPNNDISRPIAITLEGHPVDPRLTRILDVKALENKQLVRPMLVTLPVENIPTRVITVPLIGRSGLLGFAQYGHDLKDFDRLKETQTTTIVFLLPFVLFGSIVVGWFLAGLAVQPIKRFAEASEAVSESDMSVRIDTKGNDEIARLGQSFNSMVDRLQLSFHERQRIFDELQATLEQQKQFVGDASHELRTPLARLRITTSSALEQDSTPDEMKEALEIADRETVQMSNLVDQLLMLARLDSGRAIEFQAVDLLDIAKEAASKFPSGQPNSVLVKGDERAVVQGNADSLIRAVSNLIENARRYCPDHSIEVSIHNSPTHTILLVRDFGSGIEQKHLGHLTERFYRIDDARNRKMGGTGLGLAIVKSIVESHHGRLDIQSKVGEGTAVQLIFPLG